METIRTFIDNVFMAFPDNEKTQEVKEQILKSSEEKFIDLLKEGKNENEAVGIVIEEFGDANDLSSELGYKSFNSLSKEENEKKEKMTQEYTEFRKKFAVMIASGVGLIFLGIILATVFSDLDVPGWVSVAGFFVPLAIAIGLFIVAGMEDDSYQSYFKEERMYGYIDDDEFEDYDFSKSKAANKKINTINSTIGLVTVAIYLYIGFAHGLWHPGWIIFIVSFAIQGLIKAFIE